MATPKVYVLCDENCKFEGMTKEQILAAIAEATGATVTDVDEAFITKIKEQNGNNSMRFWVGTEAEYNTIVANGTKDANTIYCIKKLNGDAVLNYGVGIASIKQTETSSVSSGENVITFTMENGVQAQFVVKNGAQGGKGDKGDKGDKGNTGTSVTVTKTTTSNTDGGSNVVTFSDGKTLTVKNGSKGSTGDKGDKGDKPQKYVDYWTEADKTEIVNDVLASLPNASGVSF